MNSEILLSAGCALGSALAQVVHLLDPGLIVLGGGLGTSGLLLEPIRSSLVAAAHRGAPPLVPAQLGADSGLLGAALFARSFLEHR
ncbi:MAG: ROK family protein [Propionibacteriaceae bacterium]|jgi:glucokinase|nr:ROK family protein [Propionibacteriaceae bacterium]